MPQVNQLGGSAVVNANVTVEKPKGAAKKRKPGVHYCPSCDLECVAEVNRDHTRFSCPNGKACPMGSGGVPFHFDDYNAVMRPIDAELMAGLDAPSHHENTQLGEATF